MIIDTMDKDFEKIISESDVVLCCKECADTGFQLGKEFERNRITNLLKDNPQLIDTLFGAKDETKS